MGVGVSCYFRTPWFPRESNSILKIFSLACRPLTQENQIMIMLKCRLASILNCLPKFYGAPADGLNFLDPRKVSTPFLLEKLIIIVGSSGLEPLPKGPDLQSGCRIRTTFTTQFFVLLKFKTFYCSNFRFLYLERELNPHHLYVRQIRSRYAIEAKCMFLNFPLINIQTKCIRTE